MCTKHDLDSLIGQLQHASAVAKLGRSFLHHMIIPSKSRQLPSHPIHFNQGFCWDLAWRHLFLKHWNGISPMSAIGQDTCSYLSFHCIPGASTNNNLQISMGKHWKGTQVLCRSDNLVTVENIQSRYSRDDNLMHSLCCLFFVGAAFNFSFISQYLPGWLNDVVDALSNNNPPPTLLQAKVLEQQPTEIPIISRSFTQQSGRLALQESIASINSVQTIISTTHSSYPMKTAPNAGVG